jgi:hypothetical protein
MKMIATKALRHQGYIYNKTFCDTIGEVLVFLRRLLWCTISLTCDAVDLRLGMPSPLCNFVPLCLGG